MIWDIETRSLAKERVAANRQAYSKPLSLKLKKRSWPMTT